MHKLLLTSLIAIGIAACGNDNGGTVIDGGVLLDMGCRVEPSYTSLHDNLFSTGSCNAPSCHNSAAVGTIGGSMSMADGKAATYMELTTESTFDNAPGYPTRTKANDSMNSFLYRKLVDSPPPGTGGRMPLEHGRNLVRLRLDSERGKLRGRR